MGPYLLDQATQLTWTSLCSAQLLQWHEWCHMSTCGIHNHIQINSNWSKSPSIVTAIQSLPSKDKAFPFLKTWLLSNLSLLFTTHSSPESIHFINVGAYPSSQAHLKFLSFSPIFTWCPRNSDNPNHLMGLSSLICYIMPYSNVCLFFFWMPPIYPQSKQLFLSHLSVSFQH